MKKWYHSTKEKLPKSFIVKKDTNPDTLITMSDDYGIDDWQGGLFVSEKQNYSTVYGSHTYEITSKGAPIMINWGIYVFPVGTRVNAKLIRGEI